MVDNDMSTPGAWGGKPHAGTRGARLSARARWRLALGLLLAGGALGGLALFSPWALGEGYAPQNVPYTHFTISIFDPFIYGLRVFTRSDTSRSRLLRALLPTALVLYAALGALMALALATRRGARARLGLLFAEAIWLAALMLQLLGFSAQLVTGHGTWAMQFFMQPGETLTVTPAPGLWLGWLAVALGAAGVVFARQALRCGLVDAPGKRVPRSQIELASAALATLGVVIWGTGYYTLPWATQGCSGLHVSLNHFVSGNCAGLDAADVFANSSASGLVGHLTPGTNSPLSLVAYLLTNTGFQYVVLALLAFWAMARMWAGAGDLRRYGWALAWLIGAAVVAVYTAQGAASVVVSAATLIFGKGGVWVYGPGLAVALVGLALAASGLAGAALAARSQTQASSLVSASTGLPSSSRPSPTARSVGEKM